MVGTARATFGGPILKDKVNFFVAYDGKVLRDSRQVVPRNLDKLPAGKGIVPWIASQGGSYVDSFNEHLIFGKVNAETDEHPPARANPVAKFTPRL